MDSFVVAERGSEENRSNFHGLEKIRACTEVGLLTTPCKTDSMHVVRTYFHWRLCPLPGWHNQTTVSKSVNIQKSNRQSLVAVNYRTWELMIFLKKANYRFERQSPLPHQQHSICCSVILSRGSDLSLFIQSKANYFFCVIFPTKDSPRTA